MNLVILLLLASIVGLTTATLAPVVFVPGYLGNSLLVSVDSKENIPKSCSGIDIPIGVPFLAMYNATLLAHSSKCVFDLLTLDFDASKSPYFFNKPGIAVSVLDFGGFSGIEIVYHGFKTQLTTWGYEIHKNAFGAPADYRFMSVAGLASTGFTDDLKALVEKAYRRNDNRRVVLIGHSNGGPTIYTFLASMSSAWKFKYISSMIGLSGNFLGQMNCIKPFVVPSAESEMMATWEAQYMSLPWGEYAEVASVPIVFTNTQNPSAATNYTSKVSDLSLLFSSIHRSEWGEMISAVAPNMDRSAHPGVDTFCFYGSNLSTSFSFSFAGSVEEQGEVVVGKMEGDGNQDILDQQFCERVWAVSPTANNKWATKAQAFPNVHHMQMVSDEVVLAAVYDVLQHAE